MMFDLALKAIGAGGVVTVVVVLLRLARELGAFETKVTEGFKTNEATHQNISDRIDRNYVRVDTLISEVGELRGEVRRMNGNK